MPRLISVGFAVAALGFVLSALVHVASFFAEVPMRSVWPLHVGGIALGFPFVFAALARRRGRFLGPSVRELLEDAPRWGERAFQLLVLNFILHFGALLIATRTLTVDRPAPPGAETRVFSAFWMTLYLLFTLAWWKGKTRARPGA